MLNSLAGSVIQLLCTSNHNDSTVTSLSLLTASQWQVLVAGVAPVRSACCLFIMCCELRRFTSSLLTVTLLLVHCLLVCLSVLILVSWFHSRSFNSQDHLQREITGRGLAAGTMQQAWQDAAEMSIIFTKLPYEQEIPRHAHKIMSRGHGHWQHAGSMWSMETRKSSACVFRTYNFIRISPVWPIAWAVLEPTNF